MGRECNKCGRENHFASICRIRTFQSVDQESAESEYAEFQVLGLTSTAQSDDWYADLKVNENQVKFKLDTGAQANVMPESVYRELNIPLRKTSTRLVAYGGTQIPRWDCRTVSSYKDVESQLELTATPTKSPPNHSQC